MQLSELNIPPKKQEILGKKGIISVESLLYSTPKKYLFFDKTYSLVMDPDLREKIESKTPVAIIGICREVDTKYSNGRSLIKVRIHEMAADKFLFVNIIGEYRLLAFYRSMIDRQVIVGGVLQYSEEYHSFSMLNPAILSDNVAKYKKIVPVYRKYKGISEEYYEKSLNEAISMKGDLDYIPNWVINKYGLPDYKNTIQMLHFPSDEKDIVKAQQRIVFDDMVYFTCKLEEMSKLNNSNSKFTISKTNHVEQMITALPFSLTNGQDKAIHGMIQTAREGKRISSLVQGDVGSGKTMVAFSMMLAMAENGYQSVLMAPTAVLAKQHYLELQEKTKRFGYKCAFLCNELTSAEKKKVLAMIASGECHFIIGTHSCISKSVEYANLALTVTDEEHKFGVLQREALIAKSEAGVHNIIMSGTPIPRTLANTFYGNSTEVYSMELPGNRQPIQTAICSSNKPVFEWILKEIRNGHQCYVVCPLIDKAEDDSKMAGVSSLEETLAIYKKYFTPLGIQIGCVTGKTTKEEQGEILKDFKENKTQILMATTVIEVGVNVPNATVMVITGAERFGLATLHQLRGRVGRGSDKSYCILQKSSNVEGGSNLEVLCRETDGLEIAKEDMKHRGTGNLLGKEQSGQNKFIELMLTYPNMYEKVRELAKELCKNNTGKDIIRIYEENYCKQEEIFHEKHY